MGFDERRLIENLLAPLAQNSEGAFGLADDAAVLTPESGTEHVISVDTIVSGVHFRPDDAADLVAKKALRVNVSDIAAKGAEPFAWFMSLGLPKDHETQLPPDWIAKFVQGLAQDQDKYGLGLYGGDTVRSPGGVVISITMIGRCNAGASVRRFTARDGDLLYVSGTMGDAALGLHIEGEAGFAPEHREFLAQSFLLPDPPVALAPSIRNFANAAMDISDGLVSDLGLMCEASGLGARVLIDDVPLSEAASQALLHTSATMTDILAGGDDYQILAAVPMKLGAQFEISAAAAGHHVTNIGRTEEVANGVRFIDARGQLQTFPSTTFRHF